MRKVVYIPGIISLAGLLSIFSYIILPATILMQHETVIKHSLPSDDQANPFSGYNLIDKMISKKRLIHINLTGSDTEDDKKIEFIRATARGLKYTCDTASLIEIHLSDEITYGRFVQLVNIMLKDEHKRYCLWKNNFYVFGEAPAGKGPVDSSKEVKPIYL